VVSGVDAASGSSVEGLLSSGAAAGSLLPSPEVDSTVSSAGVCAGRSTASEVSVVESTCSSSMILSALIVNQGIRALRVVDMSKLTCDISASVV
jgi:hypothetical protein